jgi:hypothetical protein
LKSLEIKKKVYGETHIFYANTLFNLAIAYHFLKENKKSKESFAKALIIAKEYYSESDLRYIETL